MEGRLIFKDCTLLRPDNTLRPGWAVVIDGDRIVRVAANEEVPVLPGDWEVRCRGRLLLPGHTDAHAHLVGGQIVPQTGRHRLQPMRSRFELEERLHESLTPLEVEVLTADALARGLRHGVTCVYEHLRAPHIVDEALTLQLKVAQRLGVRLLTSHSTHGLGRSQAQAQVEANADVARRFRDHPLTRSALGFHASWSCGDEVLQHLCRLREQTPGGLHFHLAESDDDLAATTSRWGRRVVARMEVHRLLGPGTVAALPRAVDSDEVQRLSDSRTFLALGLRASARMEPSSSAAEQWLLQASQLGPATVGTGTVQDEVAFAFTTAIRLAREGRRIDPDALLHKLFFSGPATLNEATFGAPFGAVEEGRAADLVLYNLVTGAADQAGGYSTLARLNSYQVGWVVVGGRVCLREGALLGADALELSAEAAAARAAVHRRVGISAGP